MAIGAEDSQFAHWWLPKEQRQVCAVRCNRYRTSVGQADGANGTSKALESMQTRSVLSAFPETEIREAHG